MAKLSREFQVLSDIYIDHPENPNGFNFPQCAPYLILAGNVGRLKDYNKYREYIQAQTDRFDRVFLVLGNHEYYGSEIKDVRDAADQLQCEKALGGKLVVLDRRRYDIPWINVTILGCTLWDQIPDLDGSLKTAMSQTDDHKEINGWSMERHNEWFLKDVAWLDTQIEEIREQNRMAQEKRQVLVITHHPPNFTLERSPFFLLEDRIPRPWSRIHTWVYGHSHSYRHDRPSTDFKKTKVHFVSNQRSYPSRVDVWFKATKAITVD